MREVICTRAREGEIDRQTDRQTDKQTDRLATRRKYKAKDNLTACERSPLKALQLMARVDVAIKPADKGSEVVVPVLEKADYLQEAERQLGNGWEVSLRLYFVFSYSRFFCLVRRN